MSIKCEYEARKKAIELYRDGMAFMEIIRTVHRSGFWMAKWLRRYQQFGLEGLQDQSRTPKRVPHQTPEFLVRKILVLRDELAAYRTRRAAFAGIGAETIHFELQRRGLRRLPAISTIEKILARSGRTKKIRAKRSSNGPPYPYVPSLKMGDLQQTDLGCKCQVLFHLVGPRHLRGPKGVTRFYSIHTIDVAGQTAAASQFRDKSTISLGRHLVDSWRVMSLPRVSQMDNEMAATGGGRYRHSLSQLIRLHLLLGVHLRFIPPKEPGRNAAIESFNAVWQARVLRHPCPDLRALRQTSERFLRYYHF